ncbi:hypothetical protein HOT75_gp098 [Gordonia phage Daredevil]|uniref:Uncharacterized protein n=1 Tax=Gordonia phage Daredevil TaxID=2283286 RepID=A0A345MIV4_9CAUD|nr:hypothetical protein HOT75_gp098 [Gordonia phage Daredevil]AXH70485.1 hypothetical protein SEA_DAREDEVIL_98 [Gordonia phage Daredevil]
MSDNVIRIGLEVTLKAQTYITMDAGRVAEMESAGIDTDDPETVALYLEREFDRHNEIDAICDFSQLEGVLAVDDLEIFDIQVNGSRS